MVYSLYKNGQDFAAILYIYIYIRRMVPQRALAPTPNIEDRAAISINIYKYFKLRLFYPYTQLY